MATIEDFHRLDLRIGRVVEAVDLPRARRPSYCLTIDFGPLGIRRSVAALAADYDRDELRGRQVVCVFNLPPRRVAGVESQVLILAATEPDGTLRLLRPDADAELGSHVS